MTDYGKRICQLRLERGLSQRELGERVGLNQQQISFIERNERGVSFTLALKLAKAFDINVTDLAAEATPEPL